MSHHAITIRAATTHDYRDLARLATLGCHRNLTGGTLLAEADEGVVAAIALTSGRVLADPANPDTGAIHSLRRRRYEMLRQGGDVGPARALFRRLAPVPDPLAIG